MRATAPWPARLALIASLLPALAAAQAVSSSVAPRGGADEVERGRQLYMSNGCHTCHGTVGQGGERSGAPKLAPAPHPIEAFRALVRTPREAMPRYDVKYLSEEQLLAVHGYLASIAKGPSAKDIPQLRALLP